MLYFENDNGKTIAEFIINYPFEDFFMLVNHIKKYANLKLIRTDTKQIDENENMISSHIIYYSDLKEQIGIRIKESSFSIDFGHFVTLSSVLDREQSNELTSRMVREIRIKITSRNENNLYSVSIDNIRKYYIMESTSQFSNYEIKKVLDGKRKLKLTEVRLN